MKRPNFFPELGSLVIDEVYVYHDEPMLFSCMNSRGDLFLGLLVTDQRDLRTWLYAPTSYLRLQQVRSGGLSVREAFTQVEDGYVFEVNIRKSTAAPLYEGKWVAGSDIPPEQLPDEDVRLELATQTLPEKKVEPMMVAQQTSRNVIAMAMSFLGMTRSEAPAGHVGKILQGIQEVMSAAGNAIAGKMTTRGDIPKKVRAQTQLTVANAFAGSFGVELRSLEPTDLFGEAPATDALAMVADLLIQTEKRNLQEAVPSWGGRLAGKYRDLLKVLSATVSSVEVDLASPGWAEARHVHLNQKLLKEAYELLLEMTPLQDTTFVIVGQLVGFNSRTNVFELLDTIDSTTYKGKVDDDALEFVGRAIIDDVYNAELRQREELKATGEISVSITLKRLWVAEG